MSLTELKMSFPTEKLNALRFFMGKKDQSIEKELQDYLDKTYEKLVPAQLREYLESRIETPSAQEQTPDEQQISSQEQFLTNQQMSGEQEPINQQVSGVEAEKTSVAKERPVRSARRQKEQSPSDQSLVPETAAGGEGPAEQEENQGISMSM